MNNIVSTQVYFLEGCEYVKSINTYFQEFVNAIGSIMEVFQW